MHSRTLALAFAVAVIGTGCVSKETKPEPAAAPVTATAVAAPAPPEATPVTSKPECPAEPTTKAKSKKSKTKKKSAPVAVDCEPAKPKTAASDNKASPPAAPTPVAAAPAKEAAKPSEPGKPRMMKSVDGTFEGEVYGNIPPNSKWAKLQIGMEQPEIERILGVSHLVTAYPTAKAFIPFYYGTDRTRYEVRYPGQGSVSYTGGSWGGGQGVVMMINYDPAIK